jgi:hypothetical protein
MTARSYIIGLPTWPADMADRVQAFRAAHDSQAPLLGERHFDIQSTPLLRRP